MATGSLKLPAMPACCFPVGSNLKFCYPVTPHCEAGTGAMTSWGQFSLRANYRPVSLQLSHDVFVIYCSPTLNLSFKTFPLFCLLFSYGTVYSGYVIPHFRRHLSMTQSVQMNTAITTPSFSYAQSTRCYDIKHH